MKDSRWSTIQKKASLKEILLLLMEKIVVMTKVVGIVAQVTNYPVPVVGKTLVGNFYPQPKNRL
jgi:hypothetical protein